MSISLPFKSPIEDRLEIIEPLVKNRKTLDLGVIDSRSKVATTERVAVKSATSLHQSIHDLNPDVIGIDIDAAGIELLKQQNFNVQAADVITMDLGQQYDTIIAGDIIEHLTDAGRFLVNMKSHLTRDGVLVITTPNPFYIKHLWKILRYNSPQVHEDHTCWFCPLTLTNLCTHAGLSVIAVHWIRKPGQFLKTWPKYWRDHFSNSFLLLAQNS